MGLLADVKTLLTNIDNVYLGNMPDKPDNMVGVFATGGFQRSLSGTMVEEPTFMIKVRNTKYTTGETLCDTIKDLLHGVNNHTIGTGGTARTVLLIEQQSDVLSLGRDENKRQVWSINFRMLYRR